MEASAFLQTCAFTNVEVLGIIKGVSDMGDERKGLGHDMHYRPALSNAIDATKSFLRWKLHTIPDETDTRYKSVVRSWRSTFLTRI